MLNRDEALKICETRAGTRQGRRRRGCQRSRLQSTVESHARFADNRITTSGRAEDLGITATVWVGKRRGAATGNDSSADALKQLADEAVQIARVSPVHREYVPTLGPLDLSRRPRLRRGDGGHRSECARQGARRRAGHLPHREGHRRRISHARARPRPRWRRPTATAAISDRREADLSITARSADGTGSGYFAGDHFDLAKLDTQHIVEQAVGKAVRSRSPSRSSRASIR